MNGGATTLELAISAVTARHLSIFSDLHSQRELPVAVRNRKNQFPVGKFVGRNIRKDQ
jgi:hypothetical protein